jgi:hypothetical protein
MYLELNYQLWIIIVFNIVIICFLLYKQTQIKHHICDKIKKLLYDEYLYQLNNLKLSENRINKIKKALEELKREGKSDYIKNMIDNYIKLKDNEENIKHKYEQSLELNLILYDSYNKKILPKIIT